MAPQYQDDSITIHKIKCGPYDNNAYLLVCPETNQSILIDTPIPTDAPMADVTSENPARWSPWLCVIRMA